MSRAGQKYKKELTYVSQIDYDGCAVAAIAMLAGTSYEYAHNICFPQYNYDNDINFSRELSPIEINKALKKLKIKTIRTTQISKHWDKPFMLGFDWASGGGGHVVVWCPVSRKFLDPGYKKTLRNDIYIRGWRRGVRTTIGNEAIVIIEK